MTNKKLEEKIASMERELAELKNELKIQDKIWKPKEDEMYWVVSSACYAESWLYCESGLDNEFIEFGNYFRTKEDADKQAEYNRVMNRFRKYVEAYTEPLDWEDNKEKYYIHYDCCNYNIVIDYIYSRPDSFQIYASSEQIIKDAIIYSAGSEEEFIRIVFGVENEI